MDEFSDKSRRNFLKNSLSGSIALSTAPIMGYTGDSNQLDPVSSPKNVPRLPCNILISGGLDDLYEKQISAISPEIKLWKGLKDKAYLDALKAANVFYGAISSEDFAVAKNLSWVQNTSAGVEKQVFPALVQSEVILTNAKGCYAPAIAEHVMGLLFALTRKIGLQIRQMREHKWGGSGDQIEMKDLTMGIIGFGGIGRQIARRAKAMDMKILAADIQAYYPEQVGDICDELYHVTGGGLEKLLSQSDVVVCAAPHTPLSEGMFGDTQFNQMKKGACFINVSRGKLVQTDALMRALSSGQLLGAGLDVTNPEPLPADHPLWDFENAIVTAHISGRSQYSTKRVQAVFVDNVHRFVLGYPLVNQVNKVAGF